MPEKKLQEVIAAMADDQKKLEKTAEEVRAETRRMRLEVRSKPLSPSMGAA